MATSGCSSGGRCATGCGPAPTSRTPRSRSATSRPSSSTSTGPRPSGWTASPSGPPAPCPSGWSPTSSGAGSSPSAPTSTPGSSAVTGPPVGLAAVDLDALKDRLRAEVEQRRDVLLDASHAIHEHPQLNYEEHHAHDLLSDLLEGEGLAVERHAFGVATAFAARAGSTGPTIAVLLEYDALPGLGHACGHNIIATAGLGAGLAAAALAEEVGARVVVLGTPAEEGGGGKILMAREGAFDGIDAAMMVHPAGDDLARMDVIAVQEL